MIEGDVFGCTGAAALLRRAMLDDITLDGQALDEKLFAYCDDADLSWRARLRGWKCLYAPSLIVTHGRAGRNGLRRAGARPRRALEQTLMVRNRLLVIAKCEPLSSLLLAAPRLALFEIARKRCRNRADDGNDAMQRDQVFECGERGFRASTIVAKHDARCVGRTFGLRG